MPEFKMFDKVLVRDFEDDIWVATFFSHYDIEGRVIAINDASWKYCIPALGNEHLVGTKNSEWVPKKGDLVAVRDRFHGDGWFLRIFYGTNTRNGDKVYIAGGMDTFDHNRGEWEYCEPAKKHFEFNS